MSIYDELLPRWDHPTSFDSGSNFVGDIPNGYAIACRTRNSSILDNCNFDEILADLGGENEYITVIRHGHWLVGWIEYVIVSPDSPTQLLDQCVDILRGLANYPVYNEDKYGELQFEAVYEQWATMSLRNRIDLCRENGDSIFAARRDEVPRHCFDSLMADIG